MARWSTTRPATRRTANPWQPDAARYEQVTRRRYAELEEIKRYVEHPGCLMEFLARALDDPAAAPCGKCMNCAGQTQRRSVPPALVQAAVDFLRHDALVLEPRICWPSPVLAEMYKVLPDALERYENGRPKMVIPGEAARADRARALHVTAMRAGAGKSRAASIETGRFSDALVTAAAELIQSKWKPDPPPQWVTAVPSQHHAELVQDFAQRLAAKLGLPFVAGPAREPRQAAPEGNAEQRPAIAQRAPGLSR